MNFPTHFYIAVGMEEKARMAAEVLTEHGYTWENGGGTIKFRDIWPTSTIGSFYLVSCGFLQSNIRIEYTAPECYPEITHLESFRLNKRDGCICGATAAEEAQHSRYMGCPMYRDPMEGADDEDF